jgi:hypothetical protein
MEEHEYMVSILSMLDLDDIEETVSQPYHDAGRAQPVVPYLSNQRRGEPVLRVDRLFRTSGSAWERRIFGLGRASVERVNSKMGMVGLGCLKLRGLRNVLVHVFLNIILVLVVAVAALR